MKTSSTCLTCVYNKKCPIQNAGDADNCKAKYYENSVWHMTNHPLHLKETEKC